MSKADEMFKNLGYKKRVDKFLNIIKIYYYERKKDLKTIRFLVGSKEFDIFGNPTITMQELQAINEKCKELEWIK